MSAMPRSTIVVALVLATLVSYFPWESAMASTTAAPSAPARVCRWYGGKRAALSLRFDDSHPTHVTVGLPLLNELGLVGTFLVCPGNASYQQHQAVWEGEALARGHEPGRPHLQPPRGEDGRRRGPPDRRAGRAAAPPPAGSWAGHVRAGRGDPVAAAQALRLLRCQVPPVRRGRRPRAQRDVVQ